MLLLRLAKAAGSARITTLRAAGEGFRHNAAGKESLQRAMCGGIGSSVRGILDQKAVTRGTFEARPGVLTAANRGPALARSMFYTNRCPGGLLGICRGGGGGGGGGGDAGICAASRSRKLGVVGWWHSNGLLLGARGMAAAPRGSLAAKMAAEKKKRMRKVRMRKGLDPPPPPGKKKTSKRAEWLEDDGDDGPPLRGMRGGRKVGAAGGDGDAAKHDGAGRRARRHHLSMPGVGRRGGVRSSKPVNKLVLGHRMPHQERSAAPWQPPGSGGRTRGLGAEGGEGGFEWRKPWKRPSESKRERMLKEEDESWLWGEDSSPGNVRGGDEVFGMSSGRGGVDEWDEGDARMQSISKLRRQGAGQGLADQQDDGSGSSIVKMERRRMDRATGEDGGGKGVGNGGWSEGGGAPPGDGKGYFTQVGVDEWSMHIPKKEQGMGEEGSKVVAASRRGLGDFEGREAGVDEDGGKSSSKSRRPWNRGGTASYVQDVAAEGAMDGEHDPIKGNPVLVWTPPEQDSLPGRTINQVLARSGLCSRREATEMVKQGRVAVNYRLLKDFNTRVVPGDIVTVDDEPIPVEEPTMVWKFFKPQACLSRMGSDQSGMKTVGELLEGKYGEWTQNLRLVGRLDFMTEGLMLLTNDGELKRVLELPSTGIERAYRARVRGHVEEHKLRRLAGGVQIQGMDYGSIIAKKDDPREGVLGSKPAAKDRANSWLLVSVWEGKNQEVRKAMEHVGLVVSRLIRVLFGPIRLQGIKELELQPLSLAERVALSKAVNVASPPQRGQTDEHGTLQAEVMRGANAWQER